MADTPLVRGVFPASCAAAALRDMASAFEGQGDGRSWQGREEEQELWQGTGRGVGKRIYVYGRAGEEVRVRAMMA